jgi:hypothetical protein
MSGVWVIVLKKINFNVFYNWHNKSMTHLTNWQVKKTKRWLIFRLFSILYLHTHSHRLYDESNCQWHMHRPVEHNNTTSFPKKKEKKKKQYRLYSTTLYDSISMTPSLHYFLLRVSISINSRLNSPVRQSPWFARAAQQYNISAIPIDKEEERGCWRTNFLIDFLQFLAQR